MRKMRPLSPPGFFALTTGAGPGAEATAWLPLEPVSVARFVDVFLEGKL